MNIYKQLGNPIYILKVLKKYTDEEHMLTAEEISRKVKEEFGEDITSRTIRRNIDLLKYKLDYDISTRNENKKGYYISRNPDTDFEPGEIRAIIDTFSYANYIVPSIAENVIEKCKSMQNIYENEKLKDYKVYSKKAKTENMEVIKNIEDITDCIYDKTKMKFEYWKYDITKKLDKKIISTPTVSPYAIIYDRQQFYLICIKDGQDRFYNYRLDRIKNLQKLTEKITIKKTNREIEKYTQSLVEMFGGEKEEIEAICSTRYLLDTVFDDFGKNITIEKIDGDDDHFKLILDANPMGFKMWAMRNIDLVEIIRPVSLRKEMKEIINKAEQKYKM